jgi:hypothetical protein
MLTLDYDQQIPHIDQSLFGVGCDVWEMPSENQVPICLGGHTSVLMLMLEVGGRKSFRILGLRALPTAPLKKRAAGRIAW